MTQASTNEIKLSVNEQIVADLLTNPKFGALAPVFVLEAIRFYAITVRNAGKPEEHGNSFISQIVWYETADSIAKHLEELYAN